MLGDNSRLKEFDRLFRLAEQECLTIDGDGDSVELCSSQSETEDDTSCRGEGVGQCVSGNHDYGVIEHGKIYCVKCGGEGIAKEPTSDVRTLLDTGDMQSRRSDNRSIIHELLAMKFRRSVCEMANKIFLEITDGQTYRCKSRQALIWVCVFSALKSHGLADYQILQNQMKVRNKKMMQGLKRLAFQRKSTSAGVPESEYSPESSSVAEDRLGTSKLENDEMPANEKASTPQVSACAVPRSYSISAYKIAKTIMQRFNATCQQIAEVRVLLRAVKGQSATLARSRPQSLAAAMVFYWIKVTEQSISMEEFRTQVELSPATIQRVSDEIATVLERVVMNDPELASQLEKR